MRFSERPASWLDVINARCGERSLIEDIEWSNRGDCMDGFSRSSKGAWLLAGITLLTGCANLQTINRESKTPMGAGMGKVVHLDAQQRLVVFAAERYCAEPSPDALAAYAAALGVGASHGSKTAVNAASSLNSVAGSIGLRTQSITLMRDTLYRTCEAAMNNSLSDEQVAMLMARSQDLTAVVLAIEQLTGTVAAPPITLTTGGSASSATALIASTEALNAIKAAVAKAKDERDAAEKIRTDKKTALDSAESARTQAYEAAKAAPDDKALADAYLKSLSEEGSARTAFTEADRDYEAKNSALKEFQKTEQQVSLAHESSSTAVSSSVSGGANAGTFIYKPAVDATTGVAIATEVGLMVKRLLHKDYFAEACMATIMRPSAVAEAKRDAQSEGTAAVATNSLSTMSVQTLAEVKQARDQLVAKCMDYFAKFEPHYGENAPANEKTIR